MVIGMSVVIGFSAFYVLTYNWSGSGIQYQDNYYFLVDYKNHAPSFDKFIEMYPDFTIDTDGEAVSWSTFGDVGKGRFGLLKFGTSIFLGDKNAYEIVDAYKYYFLTYEVSTNIGVVFIKNNTELILRPYVFGYLYSVGAYERQLAFGLLVRRVTFNPSPRFKSEPIVIEI